MNSRTGISKSSNQAGFSMVEMLMTAFVLSVGLLGLTVLQVMSMKSSRGSQSLNTAIQVAEQTMDQAELEGRLSWLNITDTNNATPSLADLPNIKYVNIAVAGSLVETYNVKGGVTNLTSPDPIEQQTFFTVTTTRAPQGVAVTGRLSDITVQVQFVDEVDQTGAAIPRTITLTRRILHG